MNCMQFSRACKNLTYWEINLRSWDKDIFIMKFNNFYVKSIFSKFDFWFKIRFLDTTLDSWFRIRFFETKFDFCFENRIFWYKIRFFVLIRFFDSKYDFLFEIRFLIRNTIFWDEIRFNAYNILKSCKNRVFQKFGACKILTYWKINLKTCDKNIFVMQNIFTR